MKSGSLRCHGFLVALLTWGMSWPAVAQTSSTFIARDSACGSCQVLTIASAHVGESTYKVAKIWNSTTRKIDTISLDANAHLLSDASQLLSNQSSTRAQYEPIEPSFYATLRSLPSNQIVSAVVFGRMQQAGPFSSKSSGTSATNAERNQYITTLHSTASRAASATIAALRGYSSVPCNSIPVSITYAWNSTVAAPFSSTQMNQVDQPDADLDLMTYVDAAGTKLYSPLPTAGIPGGGSAQSMSFDNTYEVVDIPCPALSNGSRTLYFKIVNRAEPGQPPPAAAFTNIGFSVQEYTL